MLRLAGSGVLHDRLFTGDFPSENPWQFSGEYSDGLTGSVYFNYRHFSPVLMNVGAELRRGIKEPSAFTQFGSCVNDFSMEEFFDHRYSKFLDKAKEHFVLGLNASVDGKISQISGPGPFTRRYTYEAGSAVWPWDRTTGGDGCGDVAQTWWERFGTLGNFSVNIEYPVEIIYEYCHGTGRRRFSWSTTMYVQDDLGLSACDGWLYSLFGGVAHHRRVKLAKWKINGFGVKPCPCLKRRIK